DKAILDTYGESTILKRRREDDDQEGPSAGSDRGLTELEYHLEEVYKVTTDQLDWVSPEGQQYPHNLLQPLPLIPDNRGRRVIPFDHFINNDLEYLRGGASSRKYTTSVTKTKAADYGHIKWIEDLVPRAMWIQEPINYDRHAHWGVSHWGRKRTPFGEFPTGCGNVSSSKGSRLTGNLLSMYTPRGGSSLLSSSRLWNGMTISIWIGFRYVEMMTRFKNLKKAISKGYTFKTLKICCYSWYKEHCHPEASTVRGDDDKLYKFKEGDFKRLRIQDIKDMLLLLVQGKLTNLKVEERFAFNVSLRMFTRSIVIQHRVEDLQLDVESYQKKLNLTKPDTYRSDLKRKEAYTAYSNTRIFIYHNKDKQNRLMRIDELHKFSVRTALDDRLKDIRMKYLPQAIWRKSDKERAAAMIQAIDK
nr:hypothetical protein [Tanacetum cinerariifolium]